MSVVSVVLRHAQLLLAVALATCLPAGAGAQTQRALELGKGQVPLEYEIPRGTLLAPEQVIFVEGSVGGPGTASVVLRVDDGRSTDWASRFNREQQLVAGSFRIEIPVRDLRTAGGRLLDAGDIRRILFNRFAGTATVTVTRASIGNAAPPATAAPRELPVGRTPVRFEPRTPAAFDDNDAITIEGVVEAKSETGFLLRVDDAMSKDYHTRHNLERTLVPGPFSFRFTAKGLSTPSGRIIDHRNITRIILASIDGSSSIRINRFFVGREQGLPVGAKAFSLSAATARLPPGFERIAPGDQRLVGASIVPVARTAPDPVVASGLKGVDFVRLPWPDGRVRVSIFTEDPGEWEYLPYPLRRSIRVNGTVALSRNWTPEQWLRERYLRLSSVEHQQSDDAWSAYGRFRGEVVSVEVATTGTGIVIELGGDTPEARHLTAVIVEPAGSTSALEHVQKLRQQWYEFSFPKSEQADSLGPPAVRARIGGGESLPVLRATSARGTAAWLSLAVTSSARIEAPLVTLETPELAGKQLVTRAWAGEHRLERHATLVLRDNRLIPELSLRPIELDRPRTFEVWVSIPDDAPPGTYRGAISFASASGASVVERVPIEIEVLGTRLPPLAKPAGFYHYYPAHYPWFPGTTAFGRQQAACDLQTGNFFGVAAGAAPPGGPIRLGQLDRFMEDMRTAQRGGVAPGWLLYGVGAEGQTLDERAQAVGAASALMVTAGMGVPVLSVADEPHMQEPEAGEMRAWIAALRRHAPLVKLGGQLNSGAHRALLPLFDVAIVNGAYGLDKANIDAIVAQNRTAWIYNADNMRLAAGFWLWQTRAVRYVQWHARSPQADPFDPTDGREADFQMFYPTLDPCPAAPAVHRDLLQLANGVVDQRWLGWLDEQKGHEAERIRAEILRRIGTRWSDAMKLNPQALDSIRNVIIDFARRIDTGAKQPGAAAR